MSEESVYNNSFIVYRFFTNIQNNRNENNKKNDTTKKIGKIHIQENEYIKNRNNFYNQEDIQGNVHYDSTHKEGHSQNYCRHGR